MPTKKELEAHIAELEAEVSALKTEKLTTKTVMENQAEALKHSIHVVEDFAKNNNIFIEGLLNYLDKEGKNYDALFDGIECSYDFAKQQIDKRRSRHIKKTETANKAHDKMWSHFYNLYANKCHRYGIPLKRGVLKRLREETAQWAFDNQHTTKLLIDKSTLRRIMPDIVTLIKRQEEKEQQSLLDGLQNEQIT